MIALDIVSPGHRVPFSASIVASLAFEARHCREKSLLQRHPAASILGSILYLARQQAAEMEPGKPTQILFWRSRIYEKQGMRDKAVDSDILSLGTYDDACTKKLRSIYERGGWRAYWEARMKTLLAHENDFCAPYDITVNYVRLGKPDLAFPRIKAAIDQKCWEVSWLMADPMMDSIRKTRYRW